MSYLIGSCRRIALALLAGACASVALAQQGPLPVVVAIAQQATVAERIDALGTLQANETAVLSANLTETVSAIHFTDGQRVEEGDLLVSLTSREQKAQLAEAQASVDDSRRQLERARELVDSRFVSAQEVDNLEREYDIANARLRAVESRLADRLIRAPFDSVVGLREISVGTLLSPGTAVATLHDDSSMKLDFSVPEVQLAKIAPGQSVVARSRAYPDNEFEGEVSVVDNQVDPVTRSIRVRAIVPNPDRLLRPGMLMAAQVDASQRQALVIPEEALLPQGSQQFVMLVVDADEGLVAEKRQVRIGQRQPGQVEIVEGLEGGERVITHGNFRVQSGQAVRIEAEHRIGESAEAVLSARRKAAAADAADQP
ncbi:efflux RND transporter periplasmic adaptor subunit [Halopseudomonas nanhaiensis]|uniref:efflux RND transporter periplasmic adaptor subunit n=1 Tax=Halopseudomonas nanhaiensis TaxID=2830842 RepID=UPI001CBE1A93|nr:efflux RND transporter periplasmic adaptor subunit [Halopseudomonas nanhaiensis]UAW99541.1 efflux RND transporter periplasmic adaptor subunit [Halopseudomonas nanhaiensis]